MVGKLLGKVVAEVATAPITIPTEAIKQGEKLIDSALKGKE